MIRKGATPPIPPPPEKVVEQLTKHVPMPTSGQQPGELVEGVPADLAAMIANDPAGGMLRMASAAAAPNAVDLRAAIAGDQRPKPSAPAQFTPEGVGLKGATEADFAPGNLVHLPTAQNTPPGNPKLVRLLVEQALEQMDLGEMDAYPEMHGDNLTVSWRTRPKPETVELGDEEDA